MHAARNGLLNQEIDRPIDVDRGRTQETDVERLTQQHYERVQELAMLGRENSRIIRAVAERRGLVTRWPEPDRPSGTFTKVHTRGRLPDSYVKAILGDRHGDDRAWKHCPCEVCRRMSANSPENHQGGDGLQTSGNTSVVTRLADPLHHLLPSQFLEITSGLSGAVLATGFRHVDPGPKM